MSKGSMMVSYSSDGGIFYQLHVGRSEICQDHVGEEERAGAGIAAHLVELDAQFAVFDYNSLQCVLQFASVRRILSASSLLGM